MEATGSDADVPQGMASAAQQPPDPPSGSWVANFSRGVIDRCSVLIRFLPIGRHRLPVLLVFALGVVGATAAFIGVQSYFQNKAQREFQGPAAQFSAALAQSMDRYLDAVNGVQAFVAASPRVGRWEFFDYARESLPRYPGIQSMDWVPQVLAAERARFERAAHDDGLFGFHFTEIDKKSHARPAGKRAHHYPIYFIEPFNDNESRLGHDLASNPDSLAVLEISRDIGTAVATRVPQDRGQNAAQPEIAIVLPIYRSGQVPETVREREADLRGFARVTVRLDEIIAGALSQFAAPTGLDIYIYDTDVSQSDRLLYFHPSNQQQLHSTPLPESRLRAGLHATASYELAGWNWSIVIRPVSSPFTYNVNMSAWGIWAIILLLTALLLQHLLSSQTRAQEIERSVNERTAELSLANAFLQAEIDERKRVEAELRESRGQAEVANRTKAEFLAMMSHELRTPLNAVIGFSEVMAQEALGPLGNEQYRGYALDIKDSGTQLLTLINDILDLSKIEAKRFSLQEDVVEVAACLRGILTLVKPKLESGSLGFQTEFGTDRHRLRADQRVLRQILLNLLSNAVKFTPPGGRISVATRIDSHGRFRIDVSDTGIGIAEEDLRAVLRPFNQVDRSLGRKYEGTGLGLSLCRRLMWLHDGLLQIESELGEGTTISLIFPPERVVRHLKIERDPESKREATTGGTSRALVKLEQAG